MDDTETSREQVNAEKIAASERYTARLEDIEQLSYPRGIDVGRIVIEEVPKEKKTPDHRQLEYHKMMERPAEKREMLEHSRKACGKCFQGSIKHKLISALYYFTANGV